MENKRTRGNLNVMYRLVGLVRPLAPVMVCAVLLGVAGFLCAIFIPVLGVYALLDSLHFSVPVVLKTACILLPILAVARGVLHYAEQGCNHFIAFKLLAFIRDKVFGVLRQLAPAKLEGRDKGDLIAVLTADIELLEVFYAHTISPICIAVIVSVVMACFIGSYAPALGLYAALAYAVIGIGIPVAAARGARKSGESFRAEFGALNGFVLDSLRGVRESLQYNDGAHRLAQINQRTDALARQERRLKEAGAAAMGISVDSLDAAKHDKFRGLPNAHALTMAGIEACKRAGLPFQLHTTVVDWNRDEVCAITDFAEAIGAVAHYIFFLIPVGRGEYIQETSLEVLENEALLREIMEKSAEVSIDVKPTCAPQFTRVAKQLGIDTRFTRGCLAGLTYCVVGSEGIVRPCAYMTEEAGDVRTQPFDEIWKTSPVFERLRTQAYSGACGSCDYKDGCGGCRARAAYYHDGDILAQDDYCAHGQQLDVHSAIAE